MKTVLCHGCFDVLHAGHLAYFRAAKKFGDKLVVSVTADRWVNKGPGRPYFSAGQRAEMVRALGIVDEVIISDHPTAVQVIEQVRPDFYVKGPDYKDLSKDVTGEIHNEKAAVEACGGKLVFTEDETFSSSTIINKFFSTFTEDQRAKISRVMELGGYAACERAISALDRLNVLVVGEPIIDIYRFCTPEGISSKSPTISARFEYEEVYRGGAAAINNHLKDFCQSYHQAAYRTHEPRKVRYLCGTQRVFEVTDIDDNAWVQESETKLFDKHDVLVAADFGHGYFNESVMEAMNKYKGFVGLNVQTNSSNYGFNVHTKHTRWDYLCLDTREIRLAEHDRFTNPLELAKKLWLRSEKLRHPPRHVSMTLGSNGSALFTDFKEFQSPSFTDNVVDATGAGDAYFAITTVLLATDCHPELVTFIGNVFAGLKTKIIGNKAAVSKAALLKAIKGILA